MIIEVSTEKPVLSLFPASPNLSGSSFHRRKNPACRFQQAGFAIRYTHGRSDLATDYGGESVRWIGDTS